jgi:hypothetical protein
MVGGFTATHPAMAALGAPVIGMASDFLRVFALVLMANTVIVSCVLVSSWALGFGGTFGVQ